MKAKHRIWKNKLAKTMFLMTVVLVAALFLGSAASAGLRSLGTGERNTIDKSYLEKQLGLPAGTLNVPDKQPTAVGQSVTERAPVTNERSAQQPAAPFGGDRGQFYAYDLYSYNTITFEQDAVIQNLYYCGIYFFSGGDCDVDGNWYVVGYYGGLYSVDKETGQYTIIQGTTIPCNSLVFDTTTYIWYVGSYVSTDALYTMDITDGTTTYVGDFGQGGNIMISLMCDTSGNMYSYDVKFSGETYLYSVDKSTGATTIIGGMGHTFCYAQEGKFDRNDDTLWLATFDIVAYQSYLATCDPDTGAVTIVNYFVPNDEIDALAIPYELPLYDHDIQVRKIKSPVGGDAGVITPEIQLKNLGNFDEYFPIECAIAKKEYTVYLTEDFESDFPPAGWTVQTIFGGSWHRNDYWSDPRPNAAGSGYCADADMNKEQNAPMLTLLTSPPIDLSTTSGAVLDFDTAEYIYYNDILLVDVSVDGGATWNNLWKKTQTYIYGTYEHVSKDMGAYGGYSDVRLRFGYFAPQTYDYYWLVDNVMVRTYVWNTEYDVTQYLYLYVDQIYNLTYPAWTPADLGLAENVNLEYRVTASAQLYGDQNTKNDVKEKKFNLHYGWFNDVAITDIPSPVSGLAQTQTPQVVLANHGQNSESVNVNMQIGKITSQTLLYSQDFSGGVFPSDWGSSGSNWQVWYDNIAGGVAPELVFYYYPYVTGTSRAWGPVMDTTSDATLELSFKQCVYYPPGNNYKLKVQYSTDGGMTWADAYTQPGGPYGPTTTTVVMPGGVPSFQFAFAFEGSSMNNIYYWFIDDVQLFSIPVDIEYDNTVTADILAGQTMTVDLPPWTPADIPPLYDIQYIITASATLGGFTPVGSYGFEDYVPPVPPTPPSAIVTWDFETWPGDWTQSGTGWMQTSGYPFYTGYCAYLPYSYATDGMWFMSPSVDTTSVSSLTLQFDSFIDWFSDSDTYFYVFTRADSGDSWTDRTPWSNPCTGNIGPGTYSVDITDDIGTATQVMFQFNGYYFDFDYWYLDNIIIGSGGSPGSPGYLPGWTEELISGSLPQFYTVYSNADYPYTPTSPHSGSYMEEYNSYTVSSGSSARLKYDTPLDLNALGADNIALKFWMYWYCCGYDYLEVQASTDGMTWNTVGYFNDPSGAQSNMWIQQTVDLSAYAHESQVYLAFLGYSAWGYNMFIDDITIEIMSTIPDSNPTDNTMGKMIDLAYNHDVGVAMITQPTDIIWDNGKYSTGTVGLSSQLDTNYPFNSQVADDFMFDTNMQVTDVHWWGVFFNGPGVNPCDFNIIFYADDGDKPTGSGMDDPTSTALAVYSFSQVNGVFDGTAYEYNVVLPQPFIADANTHYWIAIQGVLFFSSYGQFGWESNGNDNPEQLVNALQGFPLLGTPYWTDPGYGDMAFYLTGQGGGGGNWPPGTYPVQGIVQNFGPTFSESDFDVNCVVTNATGAVVYDDTEHVTGPLAPGESVYVNFLDLVIPEDPAQEGAHKLTMKTMLAQDSNPGNDKKVLNFVIQIPDTTPPQTTASISGTLGQNGWYVSDVTVTLVAIDPAKMEKGGLLWPMGVNHTYYQIDGGAWTIYTAPFAVTIDSTHHVINYYSDDKAIPPNVEPQKNLTFKQDKTTPIADDPPVSTKQNFMGTKWLITVNASDLTSGVAKVEFYVDDVLAGNLTAPPWEFTFLGKIVDHTQALVYDNAGNTKLSPIGSEFGYGEYSSQTTKIVVQKILG